MYILGISCFYHDAAACLLKDGKVVAAASEERFTRKKHDPDFPKNAILFCLERENISVDDLDYIGFYDKPIIKFERILTSYLTYFPRGFFSFIKSMPVWLHQKMWVPSVIRKELDYKGKIIFAEHHLSHAASTFFASPFEKAAILTVDGVGEWATATSGMGEGNSIRLFTEIKFPHSLGLLYTAFTYYLGFKVNSAEYKVMGLAPYGRPIYADKIKEHLFHIKDDGSFQMDMKYFSYPYGLKMINKKFSKLFGFEPRHPESKVEEHHFHLASSVQKVTEEAMLKMCTSLYDKTKLDCLCLAGGVALNCVANGKILRETPFKEIYIQPAAGDAGGAFGVASYIYFTLLGQEKNGLPMPDAYLGPSFSDEEIQRYLDSVGARYVKLDRANLLDKVAGLINEQHVIGWFQGRMEFGPRALGARSILADARNPENKDVVNLKIKFRESFRPFAPTILEEDCSEYFEIDRASPFMLLVAQVREDRRVIPSVTHVDGSARIQSVNRNTNPLYYDLIHRFKELTGCPVIINTSFNVRGEPIVCTPEDGFRCFMRTHMDYLAIGPFFLDKRDQKPLYETSDWQEEFQLD